MNNPTELTKDVGMWSPFISDTTYTAVATTIFVVGVLFILLHPSAHDDEESIGCMACAVVICAYFWPLAILTIVIFGGSLLIMETVPKGIIWLRKWIKERLL